MVLTLKDSEGNTLSGYGTKIYRAGYLHPYPKNGLKSLY